MASDEPSSPPSAGKHWRSVDDQEPEESSKRRKHHHHRHRHHHRRRHDHHSKHGGERDEAENAAPVAEADATSSAVPKPGDDDREEGEILEDEEGGGEINGKKSVGMELEGASDVESGEIKAEGADADSKRVASREKDALSTNSLKVLNFNQNTLTDESMSDKSQNFEKFSGKDEAQVKGYNANGGTRAWESGTISASDGENEARQKQPKSPLKGNEKEKKHKGIVTHGTKGRLRSRSPVSRESSHKHRKRDDYDIEDSDHNLERPHREPRDADSKVLHKKDRSISPKNFRERYKDTRRSPSYSRRTGETNHRDRSRSCDRMRERSNERSSDSYADGGAQSGPFELQGTGRNELDRYAARSRTSERGVHRERERSSSYNRLDGWEDRHGTRERERERERYSNRLRDRDSMEVDKVARRERERSSSYSRHDRREDKLRSQDGDRERETYSSSKGRDREKLRDMSRERYRERERLRDVDGDRQRDRDGEDRGRNRARDGDTHMHIDREQSRLMERDRVSSQDRHRDYRHSRYVEVEHRNEKTRSKESSKESCYNRNNREEEKVESIREEDEEDYQERIEQQLAKQDEEDVDKIKEESRKRRQAILEKYKQQQLQQHVESSSNDNEKEEKASIDKDKLQELNSIKADKQAHYEEPENRHDTSDIYVADLSFSVGKSPTQNGRSVNERTTGARELGEGTPKSERSTDMFSDDIFGESPAGVRKSGKGDDLQIDKSGLHDNWDDAEGYYSYRFGEVLDGHYEVIAAHGKGVFSSVVRAKDLKAGKGDPEEVAIKIIRNNDTMYKAGLEELVILKKLAGADPEDKRHCVRFLSSFKYRNHLCLVFESLHMNLREVLKKFGRNIGLKLTAVRAYAKQLFIALKHLRNCGVLHCDIKPDNMLVNEAKNVLKLCDFGNAMFAGKNEITPYLVSRFYRAPEIILGLPYDHPMDMWSVGCCLYELYTGKVLFPGPSNNDMLRLHMELKGPFPKKMLRKGAFAEQHFDQDLNFHATEEDPVTKKPVKRLLLNIKPKDIGALMSSYPGEDPKMLSNFKDLLERIFVLDPEKRMTVSQALSHPFITGK
ncbi:serine/threonine-protein kinase prpf4B-like [Phoenix dactylifera]|uniref:Serine/threonine-protein kinase PRP4 homolog n=1 Tax=Phoenix dactylifera TaxID=42345 RepID=A0A8B7BEA9_PHODC|nr:serine/threonine-protein kinase prpf4B-like [Phoenix dactylifera]